MKRMMVIVLVCSALTISMAFAPLGAAQTQGKEIAIVEITDKVELQGKVLQGSYIFEHDDARMAKGEACMYVYLNNKGKAGELVTSFHCTPIVREVSKVVVINVAMTADPYVWKMKEIQFAGSTKGHLVP
ncbi:MAG: hypothetical protein HY231_08075 [Acidobacteria bacterium]|nr:hypothetical protein [Acidobacteriota bacterium]